MINKHLDMTSIMINDKITILWDGMRDGRSYQVPADRVQDARLVLKREAALAANQLVVWLEHHDCRIS
jgi:hypothetical protein